MRLIKSVLLCFCILFTIKSLAFKPPIGPVNQLNNQSPPQDSVQKYDEFYPGKLWVDQNGNHINAHGGGILYHEGTYYWYGEKRGTTESLGINVYSSQDLYNWKFEGLALAQSSDEQSPIAEGSIMERPKVIYNEENKQFVMYFHLELAGQAYSAAQTGIAVSNTPTGKFEFVRSGRINPKKWPKNLDEKQRNATAHPDDFDDWWTDSWYKAIENGMFVRRDFDDGQMARDMTLFVDDDKKAYHIYSSEDNLTLHIAELTEDYLNYTGKYIRAIPAGHFEAPAVFKKEGKYYMVVSEATGWDPNSAQLLVADDIMGEWKSLGQFAFGSKEETTFDSQSTFVLPVEGKENTFIFMGDRWQPKDLKNSPYIWLPVRFLKNKPFIVWYDKWSLAAF